MSGINNTTQIPQAPSAGVAASDRSGTRVWSRAGDRSPIDSSLTRTQPIRPISPIQITQAREEVAELRGMNKPKGSLPNIELAPKGGAFGTLGFSSARSGHYAGDNSINNPYTSSIPRNLSFNGAGEDLLGTQGSPNTPLRTRNGVTGRTDGI
ncbi:Uncharacterized protein Rs2_16060 [Raphanus sativus]|nr:Uncharacterized protein Rs2_16060 [Raphanus sativus]